MKRMFPKMTGRQGTGQIVCAIVYGLLSFALIPVIFPVLSFAMQDNRIAISWIEVVYCVINGIVMIGFLKAHLADGILVIQVTPKGLRNLLWICLAGFCMMVAYYFYLMPIPGAFGWFPEWYPLNFFPVTEMVVTIYPGAAVTENPIFATAVFSLLSPFSVCGLYYATCFGPVCCKNRWLGYLTVALLLGVFGVLTGLWRKDLEICIAWYLYQLPVHLIACWTYQKADNPWAPIISLGMFNLLSSLLNIIISHGLQPGVG